MENPIESIINRLRSIENTASIVSFIKEQNKEIEELRETKYKEQLILAEYRDKIKALRECLKQHHEMRIYLEDTDRPYGETLKDRTNQLTKNK